HPAEARLQRPREARGGIATGEELGVLRAVDREPDVAPLLRPRAGEPAGSDAQREPAEPPGVAGVAGPRHRRKRLPVEAADPRYRDEPGVFTRQPLRHRIAAGPEAVRARPAEAAHADATGHLAEDRGPR